MVNSLFYFECGEKVIFSHNSFGFFCPIYTFLSPTKLISNKINKLIMNYIIKNYCNSCTRERQMETHAL